MKSTLAASAPSRLRKAWRALEEVGFLWGLAVGALLGTLAGWLALFQPGGAPGLALGFAALAVAAPLAFLGRAVVAPVPEPVPEPPPQPLPFSAVEDIPGLLTMVALPAGEFRMGSADDDQSAVEDERPQHLVRVAGFLMGQTPVTRALYREVMAAESARVGQRPARRRASRQLRELGRRRAVLQPPLRAAGSQALLP